MHEELQLTPISVHVASVEPGLSLAPHAHVKRPEYVLVPRTVTLTADEPAKQLALPNPEREFIGICAFTNPIVLSRTKGDAQAPGNMAATITAPNGALIPAGVYLWFTAHSELWVSNGTYPTMVSVLEVTRRA